MIHFEQMQDAEHPQQRQQQRGNARKSYEIKIAQTHFRKRAPALDAGRGDQEAGDGKEYLHASLAFPYKRCHQLVRPPWHIRDMRSP